MTIPKVFFDKAFIRSMIAFLLLVLLMLAISSYIYSRSMKNISTEIENNNLLVVENVTQHTNGLFKEINNTFMSVEFISSTINVSSGDIEPKHELKGVFNSLTSIMSEKNYINEIVLMSKKTDIILTSKGSMNFDDFFEGLYSSPQYKSKFWREFTSTRHKMTIIPDSIYSDRISGFNEEKALVALVSSTLINTNDFISVIFIDKKTAFKNYAKAEDEKGAVISVFDNEGNAIMSLFDSPANVSKDILLTASQEPAIITVNNKKSYVSKSDYNGFIYLVSFPINKGAEFIIDFSVFLIILSVIFGVLLAFLLSVYINKPLENILSMLNFQRKDEVSDSTKFIEQKIENILAENVENTVKLTEIKKEVKISLFMKLIGSSSYYSKNRSTVNTIFEDISSYQSVMLISLETSNPDRENKTDNKTAAEIAGKFEFPNILIEENLQNYIFIIGFNPDNTIRERIIKAFKKASASFCSNLGCFIYISAVYESLSGIYDAYGDIRTCREYRIIGKKNDIIDINGIDPSGDIYFPEDAKNKIHNYILADVKDECIEIIESVINKNVENGIYYTHYKILVNTLYFIVADALMLCKCDKKDIMLMEQMISRQLNNPNELSAEKTIRIFSNIIRLNVGSGSLSVGTKLDKTAITQYINENYDKDLYLENMSKLFGTTPKYFSNFFSRECKESFTVYLTKIRMTKAKEFLTQTDMKINDIAEKVGYTNATTFTNTFKKYNGFSPTQYREIKLNKG